MRDVALTVLRPILDSFLALIIGVCATLVLEVLVALAWFGS
jgi:hypothetical protein